MRKQKMMPAREHPAHERDPVHPYIQFPKRAPKGKRKVPAVARTRIHVMVTTPSGRWLLLHTDSNVQGQHVVWTTKLELAKRYKDFEAACFDVMLLGDIKPAYSTARAMTDAQWELNHT